MPSSASDLILVTCASGKQAAPLLPLLSAKYNKLRLLVASDASQSRLQTAYPRAEVMKADQNSYTEMRAAFRGASTVYYVGPSFHHHETQCGYVAIDAALTEQAESNGGFKHFVYGSVLNTQIRKMLNHDCKRYVEERLYESGLNYTVLKPCNFLYFPITPMVHDSHPVWRPWWNPDVANSLVVLEDLAEVSAKVIAEREKHFFADYPLCSTLPVPYTTLKETAEKVLGRKIEVEMRPLEVRMQNLAQLILGEQPHEKSLDAAQRLVLWYDKYGLRGNPTVMEALLGRKPTSVEEWMERKAKEEGSKEEERAVG